MSPHEKAMLIALVRMLDEERSEAEIVKKLDAYYESAVKYLSNQAKPSEAKVFKRTF
nr:MAG TPA: hypothetical protein [Caudoviricetes sp.]